MMDNEVRLDHPLPDNVVAEMRALYAGPSDAAYWASLEQRIMAGVATAAPSRARYWSRTGMAVAATILIAIGALVIRSHTDEIRAAYNSLMKPTPAESLKVPSGALGEREGSDSRDATLHDVIKH